MTEDFEINISLVSEKRFGNNLPHPVPFEEIVKDFNKSDDYKTLSREFSGNDLASFKEKIQDMDICWQFLSENLGMDSWKIEEVWKMNRYPRVDFKEGTIDIEYHFDRYFISCEVEKDYERSFK